MVRANKIKIISFLAAMVFLLVSVPAFAGAGGLKGKNIKNGGGEPDTQSPVITAPGDKLKEAVGKITPVNLGQPVFTDNVGVVSITNDAPSKFPLGSTMVTWTAKDAAGNIGTDTQLVVVQDTTPPVVNAPEDIVVTIESEETPVDIGLATASDKVKLISLTNNAPALFPLGTTTVVWTATDSSGNSSTDTQLITVKNNSEPEYDTVPPVVTAPSDKTMEASGKLNTVDIGQAYAKDNVGIASLINNAPSQFPVGSTNVTWIATDTSGNTGSDTQTIKIQDTTSPVVTAPENISITTEENSIAVNIGQATATDQVEVVSITNNAPAQFSVGSTTVTWMATDSSGNTSSDQQIITVTKNEDTIPPVVTAPSDKTMEATAKLNTVNIGQASASDNVAVASLTNNAPSQFPVGSTLVTWTATDTSGNTSTDTQKINVQDTTPPVITAPADISKSTEGDDLSVNIGMATATDKVEVVSIINNAPAVFPIGATTVTWTATDSSGNTSSDQQIITVTKTEDTIPPVVTAPSDKTMEATAKLNTVNIGQASASDNVAVASLTNNAPSQFPVGSTLVTWTATDTSGNTSNDTQKINVQDTTPPVITAPADISKTTEGDDISINIGQATATDQVEVVSITNNAPAQFSVGSTTVTWTATDSSGNKSFDQQVITVTKTEDTIPPVVTAPSDKTMEATAKLNTVNIGQASASDNVAVASLTNNAPSQFPVGSTLVTWTATDTSGNTSTDTQKINVQDTTPPVITVPAEITVNSDETETAVNIGQATATDAVEVQSVSNDAPSLFPVGVTTVTWSAVDTSGNVSTDTQKITVVQNQSTNLVMSFKDGAFPNSTYKGTKDACIRKTSPQGNYGTLSDLLVDEVDLDPVNGKFGPVSSLLAWDISNVPSKALVKSVSIKLDIFNQSVGEYWLYQVKTPWTEADASWESIIQNGSVGTEILGVIAPNSGLGYTLNLNTVGIQVVQDWISGSSSNNGFLIKSSGTNDGIDFRSREANSGNRPQLKIEYILPESSGDDTLPPVVSAPSDMVVEATGQLSQIDIGTASATDDIAVASITNNSPPEFPLGTTDVMWTATDTSGNIGTDMQKITVQDTTPPLINAPVNVSVTTLSSEASVNLGNPSVTDNVEVNNITNNAPAMFPLGTTAVTWTATDHVGNSSNDTQMVTVVQENVSSSSDYFVNVKDFGAKGDGSNDDTSAIQAAVDSLYENNFGGGTVFFPPGQYLIKGATGSGDTYEGRVMKNGIFLRGENDSSNQPSEVNRNNRITLRGSGRATVLKGGSKDLVIIRMSTSYVSVKDLTIHGGVDYRDWSNGVIGIGMVPEHMQDTNNPVQIINNTIENVHIGNVREGILMMCGPGASVCKNNSFASVSFRLMTRGTYLASGVEGSPGFDNNHFENITMNFMNVGLHIESGRNNTCIHCSINDIFLQESPYNGNVPRKYSTAIIIDSTDKWGLWSNAQNRFYNLPFEGNIRDMENSNSESEFYGFHTSYAASTNIWNAPAKVLMGTNGNFFSEEGLKIGSDMTPLHPKVILGVDSTDQGFLPPRMYRGQRDLMDNLIEGLVIYNINTDKLNFFDGTEWKEIDQY